MNKIRQTSFKFGIEAGHKCKWTPTQNDKFFGEADPMIAISSPSYPGLQTALIDNGTSVTENFLKVEASNLQLQSLAVQIFKQEL